MRKRGPETFQRGPHPYAGLERDAGLERFGNPDARVCVAAWNVSVNMRQRLAVRLSAAWRMRTFRAQWRRWGRRDSKALRRLDLELRKSTAARAARPSIEQIASDLCRLDRQRRLRTVAGSARWSAAVLHAYDQRLALACRALGVPEHLDALRGLDRDIERLRVETALHECGMRVPRD